MSKARTDLVSESLVLTQSPCAYVFCLATMFSHASLQAFKLGWFHGVARRGVD
jgi:hypothetical protein